MTTGSSWTRVSPRESRLMIGSRRTVIWMKKSIFTILLWMHWLKWSELRAEAVLSWRVTSRGLTNRYPSTKGFGISWAWDGGVNCISTWPCPCVRPGRLFISWLLKFMRGLPKAGRCLVPENVRKDLLWWRTFIPQYNGASMMPWQRWSLPDQVVATDAWLQGCGACFQTQQEYSHAQLPENATSIADHTAPQYSQLRLPNSSTPGTNHSRRHFDRHWFIGSTSITCGRADKFLWC